MKKKIIIISGANEKSQVAFEVVKDKFQDLGYKVVTKFDATAELMIIIGGDGSFLRAIHHHRFSDIPIVGINTGHLGFFQEVLPQQIDQFIENYTSGNYDIHTIHPMEAMICTKTSCIELLALNEFVVRGDKSRTVHMTLSVNGNHIQKFSGDGVIISTPIGSTAYNYSSGGCIVDPSLKTIQITPLSPINTNAYRSFTSSIVLPKDALVQVNPEYRFENSILITRDGIEHKYYEIVDIVFRTSDIDINMIRFKDYEFWKTVKEKFL